MPRLDLLFPLFPCLALGLTAAYASGCGSSSGGPGGGNGSAIPPHAVGVILLGESHASGSLISTPVVSAGFAPDSTAIPAVCTTQVAGCTVSAAPHCGTMGCGPGATCGWDTSCQPTCQLACTLSCGTGQECYFPSPGQTACRTKESFDAGALVFVGTATPITLFPPYAYQGSIGGAPFMAGAEIQVQASGASGAGFDKFSGSTSATARVTTNPPLSQIAKSTVFGLGALPIGWIPGSDTVTVMVAGAGAIVTCPADDTSGQFEVPRAAIAAAQGVTGGSTLSLAVTREHDSWNKSASTHGTLTTATVQPVGWVELSTLSTETATVQGCVDAGQTLCPDGCFDTSSDPLHCGSCTVVCGSGEACFSGQCSTGVSTTSCTACETQAEQGGCATAYTTCAGDMACTSYGACAQACAAGDTSCTGSCASQYPAGYSEFTSLKSCVCSTACSSACASVCAQ